MNQQFGLPLSAGLSGVIEVLSTHWIDRIKTKTQELVLTGSSVNFSGTIKNIYSTSGITGFYTGIVPRLVGIIPMRMTYWTTMIKMNGLVENQNLMIKSFAPGLIAGFAQTLLDNPIEMLKTQLMTNNKVKKLFNVRTLYKGFVATLVRNQIFAIIVAISISGCENKTNKFWAGACGGFIGSILSQPFDVIKTEIQRSNSTSTSITDILRRVGKFPLKLWSGGTTRCSMAFLNMGIGFYALGHIQKLFE